LKQIFLSKMTSSAFDMDSGVLEINLFSGQSGKKGKNQLSANYLPHLFHYVKSLLTETERNSMKDYDVQVFIIETAIGQKKFNDLNLICDYIIKEIRSEIRYWIKGTEPFMKIYEDMKAIGENDEKMDAVVLSMKEENENAFKEFREYHRKLANIEKEELYQEVIIPKELKENKIISNKSEEVIKPSIEQFIPSAMNFKYKIYETAVDNYYSSKDETFSKKIRTRWQDRRDQKFFNCPQEIVKNYVGIFKELRDNDPNFANSIFVCNRNNKIPRIEIQLFPLIFQFFTAKYDLKTDIKTSEQVFLFQRMQNLIYLCLLTDDKANAVSQNRVNKAAFLENDQDQEGKMITEYDKDDFEDKEEHKEEDDAMEEETEEKEEDSPNTPFEMGNNALVNDFKHFCTTHGINVDTLFGSDWDRKRRKFSLLSNALRVSKIFIEKISKWELSIIPTLDAQDATFDNFKIRDLIVKLDSFDYYSDDVLETIIDYYHLEFEHRNIWRYIENMLQYRSYALKETPRTEKEEMQGVFSDKKFCLNSIENYQNYFNSPTIAKKRSYIFHTSHRKKFTADECKRFLEGLHKYYDTPVNNKRIAKHIGPHIKPNHVRFLKGDYLRQLRKKAKADNIPIRELLKTEIETNNIKDVMELLNNTN